MDGEYEIALNPTSQSSGEWIITTRGNEIDSVDPPHVFTHYNISTAFGGGEFSDKTDGVGHPPDGETATDIFFINADGTSDGAGCLCKRVQLNNPHYETVSLGEGDFSTMQFLEYGYHGTTTFVWHAGRIRLKPTGADDFGAWLDDVSALPAGFTPLTGGFSLVGTSLSGEGGDQDWRSGYAGTLPPTSPWIDGLGGGTFPAPAPTIEQLWAGAFQTILMIVLRSEPGTDDAHLPLGIHAMRWDGAPSLFTGTYAIGAPAQWCYNPTSNHYVFQPTCPGPPFISGVAPPTITVTGVSPRST